ncbi:MAG: hypothetical protein ABSE46_14035 [Terracidiphilus sp.]|jgi:hypothetical protein
MDRSKLDGSFLLSGHSVPEAAIPEDGEYHGAGILPREFGGDSTKVQAVIKWTGPEQ